MRGLTGVLKGTDPCGAGMALRSRIGRTRSRHHAWRKSCEKVGLQVRLILGCPSRYTHMVQKWPLILRRHRLKGPWLAHCKNVFTPWGEGILDGACSYTTGRIV